MASDPTDSRDFDRLLGDLRPKLHRYCARMTGSVIDGEDVVQDALLNAFAARAKAGAIANVEAWIFRIAHNAALDFLRRRASPSRTIARGSQDDRRSGQPRAGSCFVALEFAEEGVVGIRDFLFARYAVDGADIRAL